MGIKDTAKIDLQKLSQVTKELDEMGYDYIEGFVSNKKDKVRAIHRDCGKERFTKFSLYDKKECRYCKRKTTKGKYQKCMNLDDKKKVLELHSQGKNYVQISEAVGFTPNAVGSFIRSNGLEKNSSKKEISPVKCQVCNTEFVPKYKNKDKTCSKECVAELIRRSKIKYTKHDIKNIIKYKEKKFTNDEISQLTKVNINKIKEIVKENNLVLSLEDAQANAYKKKLEKNPNCMEEMRDAREYKYTIVDLQQHALKKEGECLSTEYVGFKKKYKWKCSNNHIFSIPFRPDSDIWCRKCYDENRGTKYNIEDLKEHALKKEGKCLSTEYVNYNTKYEWKCKEGHIFEQQWGTTICQKSWCPYCSTQHSKAEQKILEWVQQWYPEAHSTRKIIPPKEIDIYIPSLNLAIEYCGLYWHNENSPEPRDRNYHRNKMLECNRKGVRLITIFEDEWKDREAQVKNFLKSVMNVHDKRIYARKCNVKEIDKKIAHDFLEQNHIQGKTSLRVAYGLFYNEELLGLITGNQHHRNADQFTLNRLVFKSGVQIVGGASKLLKSLVKYAQEKGFDKIISWSDNRYSEGNVYEKCGFKLEEELSPDYSYVTPQMERQSKQSNKKTNLLKKGASGTMKNTEKELSLTLGYSRIWDCGKKRYVKKLS